MRTRTGILILASLVTSLLTAPLALAAGERFTIVTVDAEVATAEAAFQRLRGILPIHEGDGAVLLGAYDVALENIAQARTLLASGDQAGATPHVADANAAYENLLQQIPFDTMELMARVRAQVAYYNAQGALRRAFLFLGIPGKTRFIAHGLFLNTYYDTRSRQSLYRFATTQCVAQGFRTSQALDTIPCSFPQTDTVDCRSVFACVE